MARKVQGRMHARRGTTEFSWCGRKIVGVEPHGQEVRRSHITTDESKVTCGSCRNNSGMAMGLHR
jgi:hypothetical protein